VEAPAVVDVPRTAVPPLELTEMLGLIEELVGVVEAKVTVVPRMVVPPLEAIVRLGLALRVVPPLVPADALTLTERLVGLAVADELLIVVPGIVVPPLEPTDALALSAGRVVPLLEPTDALAQARPSRQTEPLGEVIASEVVATAEGPEDPAEPVGIIIDWPPVTG